MRSAQKIDTAVETERTSELPASETRMRSTVVAKMPVDPMLGVAMTDALEDILRHEKSIG